MGVALITFTSATFATSFGVTPVKVSNSFGKSTPLGIAIQKGEIDLVKKLVEYGADVNEKSFGMTPLMIAARYNKVEIIKILLANGANINAKDDKGFTALKYAELSLATDAAALLKHY